MEISETAPASQSFSLKEMFVGPNKQVNHQDTLDQEIQLHQQFRFRLDEMKQNQREPKPDGRVFSRQQKNPVNHKRRNHTKHKHENPCALDTVIDISFTEQTDAHGSADFQIIAGVFHHNWPFHLLPVYPETGTWATGLL